VPAEAELVKPHMDPQASPLVRFANAETKALNRKQEADVVDAMGVDRQVIKPPPPQCRRCAAPQPHCIRASECQLQDAAVASPHQAQD
jgi:aminocarboxymuconate-semialdehyde decarboxylase